MNLQGVYQGIVISNENYYSRGTITVRVGGIGIYNKPMQWDLTENFPDFIKESDKGDPDRTNDLEVAISGPLGGGRNYGVFCLPQVNEIGLVMFIGGNLKKPVWIGSLFQPTRDENFSVAHTNIPSDKTEAEGEDQDGAVALAQNMDAENDEEALGKNIVIRTKTTRYDESDVDKINWQKVSTSNIVSIEEKKIRFRHFSDTDGWDETTPKKWQEIIIARDEDNGDKETVMLEVVNDTDDKKASIKITEDGFKVYVNNAGKENVFEITTEDNGINFLDQFGNKIVGTEEGLQVETDSKPIKIMNASEIWLLGDNDTMVKYSKLIEIIEKMETHGHISFGAGPTSGPSSVNAGDAPVPLAPELTGPKSEMNSKNNKLE